MISKFFKIYCCIQLVFLSAKGYTQQVKNDSIYQSYLQLKSDNSNLLQVNAWRNARKQNLGRLIEQLDPKVKQAYIKKAEAVLKQQWPLLTASGFLEFTRTGNRANYEKLRKTRRDMLKDLVIAEVIEQKNRFLPMITDGVWLACEESTWSLPATMDVDQKSFGLPEVYNPIVDLTVAQTAALLAWTKFLLGNQLASVNSKLIPRIDYEINHRALTPFLKRNDLWWMGFTGHKPNNWNIYCNYYMLISALLASDDSDMYDDVVAKSIKSSQYFLASYPPDGGCDEGPNYWSMAGGTFGMFIQTLTGITGGKLDFSAHQKIHNMGTYMYKVHIDSNYFVNFADSPPLVMVDPSKLYAYGNLFNDDKLKPLAAYFFQQKWQREHTIQDDEINTFFTNLEASKSLLNIKGSTPLTKSNWLPDLQILTLRQNAGSAKGLFFAAKGGHNAESHNHNDVGNFVLYLDGKPVLIDVGVGTYTKDTFSENRWGIWNIRSLWHNTPLINGIEQRNGSQFKAAHTQFKAGNREEQFTLDIAGAYPPEAEVAEWARSFSFNHEKGILSLVESYRLNRFIKPHQLSFITHLPVNKVKEGAIKFSIPNSTRCVELNYDPAQFDFMVDTQKLPDPKLSRYWGKAVSRVALQSKNQQLSGKMHIHFKIINE